jgi:glycosyltransferase involved in cell wall biosynthesis
MKISIVTPTYNEQENIELLYNEIRNIFLKQKINYEHIVIDNNSNDNTQSILKKLANEDKNLKLILNFNNYGHIKSPFHGILQADGDAVILIASDFQDPLNLIPVFINKWRLGSKIVLAQKKKSEENILIYFIRKFFYRILRKISDNFLLENTTGAGIFDKSVIEKLKKIKDPYPYFRGLILELGFPIELIEFTQPKRQFGKTKNNFYTMYDIGMLGVVKHSRKPLRFLIFLGLLLSFLSFVIGFFYLIYKIIFWNTFNAGVAPMVIGFFFISSIQIVLLGLVGEYVSIILLHQRDMPLVHEKERINFD